MIPAKNSTYNNYRLFLPSMCRNWTFHEKAICRKTRWASLVGLIPISLQAQGRLRDHLLLFSVLFPYFDANNLCCTHSRISYSTDMLPGPKLLRPYQLGFRTDFGLPGFADPFDMVELMELVLSQGLLAKDSFFSCMSFALHFMMTRLMHWCEVPYWCWYPWHWEIVDLASNRGVAWGSLWGIASFGGWWFWRTFSWKPWCLQI